MIPARRVDEIGKIEDEDHPDLFVGSFGVNDREGIVEKDKRTIAYPSAAFDARYTEIIEDVLRAGLAQGGSMLILGLPIMMKEVANSDALVKNKLFEAAVKAVGSTDPDLVMAQLKKTKISDMFTSDGHVRADGLMEHSMYVVQVKTPAESKGPWDYYKLVKTMSGEEAYGSLADSTCPLVKK